MKKLLMLALAAMLVLGLAACADTDLHSKFPEYYGLEGMKGLEIYVWQDAGGQYLCGALHGTNRSKTDGELEALRKNPATLEEMKEILLSYDYTADEIAVIFCTSSNLIPESIDFEKSQEIKKILTE